MQFQRASKQQMCDMACVKHIYHSLPCKTAVFWGRLHLLTVTVSVKKKVALEKTQEVETHNWLNETSHHCKFNAHQGIAPCWTI